MRRRPAPFLLAVIYVATNKNLREAKKNKKDEFYTLYEDVEREVEHYTDQLKGKTVYCNCDDFRTSNFFRYFVNNFHRLGLKKLICSGMPTDGGKPMLVEITNVPDGVAYA